MMGPGRRPGRSREPQPAGGLSGGPQMRGRGDSLIHKDDYLMLSLGRHGIAFLSSSIYKLWRADGEQPSSTLHSPMRSECIHRLIRASSVFLDQMRYRLGNWVGNSVSSFIDQTILRTKFNACNLTAVVRSHHDDQAKGHLPAIWNLVRKMRGE